mmetsp:Transcript_22113/g.41460  ORF Transcript_22113/g.41460 Transcript_22113/m.41460 type:complete len:208 (-) Transcript_22113:220-843(-)
MAELGASCISSCASDRKKFKGDDYYIKRLIGVARSNVEHGGHPFSCLIVNNITGEILAECPNEIAQTGDPSSHAEIVAIRKASSILRQRKDPVDGKNGIAGEDMRGLNFYILTSPCPMCAAAMAFCGPDRIIHVTTRPKWAQYYPDRRRYIQVTDFIEPSRIICKKLPLKQEAGMEEEALKVFRSWYAKNCSSTSSKATSTPPTTST